MTSLDSFRCCKTLKVGGKTYAYYSLPIAEKNGLTEVAPAAGDAFDPERHQAMSMAPAGELPAGSVVATFQKGYMLNDRLLRPALVVVAQA